MNKLDEIRARRDALRSADKDWEKYTEKERSKIAEEACLDRVTLIEMVEERDQEVLNLTRDIMGAESKTAMEKKYKRRLQSRIDLAVEIGQGHLTTGDNHTKYCQWINCDICRTLRELTGKEGR